MSEAPTLKPLSECSPDEVKARGFRLRKVRSYPNAPLSERIRTAKTERDVQLMLLSVRTCRTISATTVRKCERAAAERIRELHAEAAAFIQLPREVAAL